MAVVCLTYLTTCLVSEQRCDSDRENEPSSQQINPRQRDQSFLEHTLLLYTVNNWMIYASKVAKYGTRRNESLDSFFTPLKNVYSYWHGLRRSLELGFTPLHVVAIFGIRFYITALVSCCVDMNAQDSGGRTPLSHAYEHGQLASSAYLWTMAHLPVSPVKTDMHH